MASKDMLIVVLLSNNMLRSTLDSNNPAWLVVMFIYGILIVIQLIKLYPGRNNRGT